jgi:hypothetical protein
VWEAVGIPPYGCTYTRVLGNWKAYGRSLIVLVVCLWVIVLVGLLFQTCEAWSQVIIEVLDVLRSWF